LARESGIGVINMPARKYPPAWRVEFESMQKIGFSEAIVRITARDKRYDGEAYAFVRDALDYTIKLRKKNSRDEAQRHVSGRELLEGVRQHALKEFGPMVMNVLSYWGIHRCEDIGEIVFNLISVGIFGKSEHDTIGDFKNGFDFTEAFVTPYLPPMARVRNGGKASDAPAGKAK
jgi:uncharacterized repeat protein (TIGR04138 family)